jgi:hypothetical protein
VMALPLATITTADTSPTDLSRRNRRGIRVNMATLQDQRVQGLPGNRTCG